MSLFSDELSRILPHTKANRSVDDAKGFDMPLAYEPELMQSIEEVSAAFMQDTISPAELLEKESLRHSRSLDLRGEVML